MTGAILLNSTQFLVFGASALPKAVVIRNVHVVRMDTGRIERSRP